MDETGLGGGMYVPKHFEIDDRESLLDVMRAHPFAVLVNAGTAPEPLVTHLPLAADLREGRVVLTGHLARANGQWKLWQALPRVLAVFTGPHAYVSPRHYETEKAVPTWNYITVHASGTTRILEDTESADRAQKRLIADHEPEYADRWAALPAEYRDAMLRGIVAFEILVDDLQGKFKLSQNRPAGDRRRVHQAQSEGTPDDRALALWMERLGIVP